MHARAFDKWTNSLSEFTDKAYGRGKEAYYRSRKKAEEAARHMPVLQAQLSQARAQAERKARHFRKNFNDNVYATEATILRITGIYLLVKWYQHRNQDICEKASSVKAHIVEKPVTSSLIALGLGFAIGRLLK